MDRTSARCKGPNVVQGTCTSITVAVRGSYSSDRSELQQVIPDVRHAGRRYSRMGIVACHRGVTGEQEADAAPEGGVHLAIWLEYEMQQCGNRDANHRECNRSTFSRVLPRFPSRAHVLSRANSKFPCFIVVPVVPVVRLSSTSPLPRQLASQSIYPYRTPIVITAQPDDTQHH